MLPTYTVTIYISWADDYYKLTGFQVLRGQTVAMDKLVEFMTAEHPSAPFTKDEIDAALAKMSDANQLMVADDMVFLI